MQFVTKLESKLRKKNNNNELKFEMKSNFDGKMQSNTILKLLLKTTESKVGCIYLSKNYLPKFDLSCYAFFSKAYDF